MVVDGRETITIAVYLDDEYTGGELAIVHKGLDIVIKNVAGSIVVFPSNYLHESRMLTSGRKTIITHVHLAMAKIIEGN
jgi:predicted 2-oxoglutarate/Fe(II)-dependent dioxygenase YbiX